MAGKGFVVRAATVSVLSIGCSSSGGSDGSGGASGAAGMSDSSGGTAGTAGSSGAAGAGGSSAGAGGAPPTPEPGAVFALTNRHDPAQQIGAPSDATSEPNLENEVVAFARGADGTLVQTGVFPTGGVGANLRASTANPLASQDALEVSSDEEFVFAVNAGSHSITSFRINDDSTLTAVSSDVSTRGASDARHPVALAFNRENLRMLNRLVYVVNTGAYLDGSGSDLPELPADRTRTQSSIIGFSVAVDGTLEELPGSEIPGIGANAGAIEFSDDGRSLFITERRTHDIVIVALEPTSGVPVRDAGGQPNVRRVASTTPQPFGTALINRITGEEVLLVSEGNDGAPGLSALSSYRVLNDGGLRPISVSTGMPGDPLVTGFTFGCWVEIASGPRGDFAYVANTPDGVLTSYSLAQDGTLAILEQEAGSAGIDGDDTRNGAGVLDTVAAWPFLYQLVSEDSRIAQWRIAEDGTLTRMQEPEITEADLFRPGMFAGLAGF